MEKESIRNVRNAFLSDLLAFVVDVLACAAHQRMKYFLPENHLRHALCFYAENRIW